MYNANNCIVCNGTFGTAGTEFARFEANCKICNTSWYSCYEHESATIDQINMIGHNISPYSIICYSCRSV
jgi:hypothetical protein